METRAFQIEDIYSVIRNFISNELLTPNTDIFEDLGLVGDDFHELIEKYLKEFDVIMDKYIWYFHANEEGLNFPGGLFYKAPYEQVERIPITPKILLEYANEGIWKLNYPEHSISQQRHDLTINKVTGLLFLAVVVSIVIWSLWSKL